MLGVIAKLTIKPGANADFEATMKALATVARHDWTPSSEGLISLVKGGKMLKGGKGRFASSDRCRMQTSTRRRRWVRRRKRDCSWSGRTAGL